MKAKYLLSILLFISMQLYCQNSDEDTFLKDDFMYQKVRTSDELYIYDDSHRYLMNKSPLSYFDAYMKIYQGLNFRDDPVLIHAEFGTMGSDNKPFQCIWLVMNKQLYLANIIFNDDKIDDVKKGRKDKYTIMEQETGEKFDTRYKNIYTGTRKIHGLMPAIWFTDTLFVKKIRGSEDSETWLKQAYLQMVFEEGKLIGMKGIANKTEVVKIDREAIKRKRRQR